jgi:hypothetical protein
MSRASASGFRAADAAIRYSTSPDAGLQIISGFWSAGPHELVDERGLRPGVYSARLTFGATHETVRLVRVP